MSLIALAAFATLAAPQAVSVDAPVAAHAVSLDHRGKAYRVEYRPQITASTRTIGMAAPARTATQSCVITAQVAVTRAIPSGQGELLSTLSDTQELRHYQPGACRQNDHQVSSLVEGKAHAISNHIAKVAAADHHQALAAIDAAHQLAVN